MTHPIVSHRRAQEGAGLMSSGLLERIHMAGMQAHPYTWRAEARRLRYGNFSSIQVRSYKLRAA